MIRKRDEEQGRNRNKREEKGETRRKRRQDKTDDKDRSNVTKGIMERRSKKEK